MAQATLSDMTTQPTPEPPEPETVKTPVRMGWSGRIGGELVDFDEFCEVQTLIDESVEVAL